MPSKRNKKRRRTGAGSHATGLEHWMADVRRQHARASRKLSEKSVHDLRVALRRCRTLASAARKEDARGPWKAMGREARSLFKALGRLRDTQAQLMLLESLAGADSPIGRKAIAHYKKLEKSHTAEARKALAAFDRNFWDELSRKLPKRLKSIRNPEAAFRRIAGEQLLAFLTLQKNVLRAMKPEQYHALRIELKRLRYLTENLLPRLYEPWAPDMKRAQDFLGDSLDLSRIEARLEALGLFKKSGEGQALRRNIHDEQTRRLSAYKKMMSGKNPPWKEWERALAPRARKPATKARAGSSGAKARGAAPARSSRK